jgi:hypothetical protein
VICNHRVQAGLIIPVLEIHRKVVQDSIIHCPDIWSHNT